jgi:hypothetical protein
MYDPDDEDDGQSLGYPAPFVSAGGCGGGERAYWEAIEELEAEQEAADET